MRAGSRLDQVIASADGIGRPAVGAANSVTATLDTDGIVPADDIVVFNEGTPHRHQVDPISVWTIALAGQVFRPATRTRASARVAHAYVVNVDIVRFQNDQIPIP